MAIITRELRISVREFLEACSPDELNEIDRLIALPYYRTRMVSPNLFSKPRKDIAENSRQLRIPD